MSRTGRFAHGKPRRPRRREVGALRALPASYAAGRAAPFAGPRIGLPDRAASRRAVRSAIGMSRRPTTARHHPRLDTSSRQRSGWVVSSRCTHRKQRPGSVENAFPYNRIDPKGSAGPVTSDRRAPHQAPPATGSPSQGMAGPPRHQWDLAGHGDGQGRVGHSVRRSPPAMAVSDAGSAEPDPPAPTTFDKPSAPAQA